MEKVTDAVFETQEGYGAFQKEQELFDCPYPAYSNESHDWIKGWSIAAEEARKDWASKAEHRTDRSEMTGRMYECVDIQRAIESGQFKTLDDVLTAVTTRSEAINKELEVVRSHCTLKYHPDSSVSGYGKSYL